MSSMEDSRPSDVVRLAESLGPLPEPAANPVLIVVSGLPGTGKSYVATRLAQKTNSIVLESDALRKVLFPVPTYSAEESTRLFRAINRLAEDLLKKGVPVVIDSTNLAERDREYLYHIAEHTRSKLVLVKVTAPRELVHQRLERRPLEASKSDADWSVYERMATGVEKIKRKHYTVDTSQDVVPVLDKIVKEAIG
jgi:predicted kinase